MISLPRFGFSVHGIENLAVLSLPPVMLQGKKAPRLGPLKAKVRRNRLLKVWREGEIERGVQEVGVDVALLQSFLVHTRQL